MEPSDRKVILIAGAHRSGTSALTRVVNLLGAYIPAKVMPPVPGNNERGFWEPTDLVSVNIQLLKAAHLQWDSVEPFPVDWLNSSATNDARERLRGFLRREFQDKPLFVLKDPRLCRLLPLWIQELEAFGARSGVVHCLRNPLNVAASLEKRDGFTPGQGLLIWLRHVLESEQHSRKRDRVFVEYETLMEDWATCVGRIGEELGIVWPTDPDQSKIEIESFLTRKLQHHRHTEEELSVSKDVAQLVKQSYQALRLLCKDTHDPKALSALDAVRRDLAEADLLFAPSLATDAVTTRELRESINEIQQQKEETASQLEKVSTRAKEHTSSINRLVSALEDKDEELSATRTASQQLEQDHQHLKDQLQLAKTDLTKAVQTSTTLEAQLEVAQSTLDERSKMLAEVRETAQQAQRTVSELENQLGATESALAKVKKALPTSRQALLRSEHVREELEEKLATAKVAASRQETHTAEAKAQARHYRDQLSALHAELKHLAKKKIGEHVEGPSDEPLQVLLKGIEDAREMIYSIAKTLGQSFSEAAPSDKAMNKEEGALLASLRALKVVARRSGRMVQQQQTETVELRARQELELQTMKNQVKEFSKSERAIEFIDELREMTFNAVQNEAIAVATSMQQQREPSTNRKRWALPRIDTGRAAPFAARVRAKLVHVGASL